MNLAEAFARTARAKPESPAIFYGHAQLSYRDVWSQSSRVAARLRDQFHVQPGDRVGLWLKNCPEFVGALFGILRAGAVAVPINNFLKMDEVAYMLNDAGINVLVSESALLDAASGLHEARPGLQTVRVEQFSVDTSRDSGDFAELQIREQDLALIIYTSGTTGHPKGAMLTHGNLLENVESCRQVLDAVSFDRFVVVLPMFHSFMLCVGIFLPLIVGGSMVVIKSLHPPKNIFQEIIAHQATILPGIPQLFRTLAHATLPPEFPLRLCISGAAPLPGEILREFNRKFPIPLLEGYGLSEASPVVSINPVRGPWKEGSIGVPIPGVEVTIRNDEGELLPDGQVGELCVRGGNVMKGYWNQPEETARVLRNGWLLTGDIAFKDPDGYFFITDRKKDMLLVNGINVYPREIEEVLYQFTGVKEAAVIGRPDLRKGEYPVAYVSAADGIQLEEKSLLDFVRHKLADYKVPRRIVFLPSLPRNATGKILKTSLRNLESDAG